MLALVLAVASHGSREYGLFTGLQYYGPVLSQDVYDRVAKASTIVPMYISVCADHNDTGGGAERRVPDPGDGGRVTPLCDLGDAAGALVRKRLETLRSAGAHLLHYTHTRIAYYPNGTEKPCCECCEDLPYVLGRVGNETRNFKTDGIFVDNSIANDAWLPYYQKIAGRIRRAEPESL